MRRLLLPLFGTLVLSAHPMGNFSVSHFTKFDINQTSVYITYVLDLAEIPTYQLIRDWKLDPSADASIARSILETKATAQAATWMEQLYFTSNGGRIQPRLEGARIKLSDGAGGMHVSRIETSLRLGHVPGKLAFEDRNYPDRAGWKEIVITSSDKTPIIQASQTAKDQSRALTEYPADPTLAPPQDLRANMEWQVETPVVITKIVPIPQPAPAATQASTPTPGPASKPGPGEVTRGDYLSRMLSQHQVPVRVMLIGLAIAFAFGALHARSPGHGKTMVAAYLVGSRGTFKQAAVLGGIVTLTHTISVFLLGLVTLFFAKFIAPERLVTSLSLASGISIVAIGASLLYRRLRELKRHSHHHLHGHGDHHHADSFVPDHDHGPNSHSHVPQGEVTVQSLIALGASGGMVPCPSALVLLLVSISLGHVGLGLLLLVSFSLGLAGVLMAIGMIVIYARQWLPDPVKTSQHRALRLIPAFSAFVIVCIGLVMTAASLGLFKPTAFLS